MTILDYLLATRPWSFSASIIGALLTSTLLHAQDGSNVFSKSCIETIVLIVLLQAAGNLLNSIFDFRYGVDNVETVGDRTLVDGIITQKGSSLLALTLTSVATWIVIPNLLNPRREFLYIFLISIFLAASYTAPPLKLKYRAMGDVVVIVCFGPLAMLGSSILMSGSIQYWILPYSIPHTLLTEAIVHANNARDIKHDAKAGISTLAMKLGFGRSRQLYLCMIYVSFILAIIFSMRFIGCLLVFLSVPLANSALKSFSPGQTMLDIDEKTAHFHFVFNALLSLGIYLST